jgi:hypothetical protein
MIFDHQLNTLFPHFCRIVYNKNMAISRTRLFTILMLLAFFGLGVSCGSIKNKAKDVVKSSATKIVGTLKADISTVTQPNATQASNGTPVGGPSLTPNPNGGSEVNNSAATPLPTIDPNAKGQAVYTDELVSPWQDWSWGTQINFSNAQPVHGGKASMAVTHTQGWAAVSLHTETLNSLDYVGVRFWINGGAKGGQKIGMKILSEGNGNIDHQVVVMPEANTWTQVIVPLSAVGDPETIGGLAWQEFTGSPAETYYLDDIDLIPRTGPLPPTATPSSGTTLVVDAQAERHSISPYIYGMNYADVDLAKELKLPVNRWGGNAASRYNWQIDVHNTGSDWFFENIPDESKGALPDGSTANQFIDKNNSSGTATLLTIPMVGWTPKARPSGHPYDCGFKVSKYGSQKSTDPYDTDCGNGVDANDENLTGNDPTDTSIAIGPEFVQNWIKYLIGRYGTADKNGVKFYNLDNEPYLWYYTHRDVHPARATYDELRDLTFKYGAAIKAVDPAAQTLGPVEWGWCGYFYSSEEDCKSGKDHLTHQNKDFLDWYLQQMQQYEKDHGVRILDYLDLHIYPQAEGVYSGNRGSADIQAIRLRSTRSLWDPTYEDESWIAKPIMLIPRMHEWVDKNYPGTKLAISEYNWGALEDINGALAQADILGIFGRERLDLATLWAGPNSKDPGAFSFRIYRNYDGSGGMFGETSVHAASNDQDKVAIYAAQREKDKALTIVVINKSKTGQNANLKIANFNATGKAQVYQYSPVDLKAILKQTDASLNAGEVQMTFPGSSITMIVIPGD